MLFVLILLFLRRNHGSGFILNRERRLHANPGVLLLASVQNASRE